MTTSIRTSRQESILYEAADRIRRYTALGQHAKHKHPIIVIVTKFDAWSKLLGVEKLREAVVCDKQGERGALDVQYVEEVSGHVRALLWKLSPEIVSAVEDFVDHVLYIPVSATGRNPEIDEKTGVLGVRPSTIRPLWAEVPLLYALCRWQRGMIPSYEPAGSKGKPSHSPKLSGVRAG